MTVADTLMPIRKPTAKSRPSARLVLPRELATFSPNRQPRAPSQAMNQKWPPQLRATKTPSVAAATVSATSHITRPNRVAVEAREGWAYPYALMPVRTSP